MGMPRTLADWLKDRNLAVSQLATLAKLDLRVVESIVAGRYTTSPAQRQQIAAALDVDVEAIRWGRALDVDHMYGHGPQFGRSP